MPTEAHVGCSKVEVVDRYVEWLFGPRVWGLATVKDGQPVSTPTIDIVINYDMQLRKKQSELMNLGHDFQAALKAAQDDKELRQVHFLDAKTCALTSEESKKCTAPGIRETFGYGAKKPEGPPTSSQQPPTARWRRYRELLDAAR